MPAGMYYPYFGKIQPEGQISETAKGVAVVSCALPDLPKELCMLVRILFRMIPQKAAVFSFSCPADRVELMISHYSRGCAGFAHGTTYAKHLKLFRSPIYKITNKD